jgi:hypothetical protein
MSNPKKIHPRVKKKELTALSERITRMCLNRGHLSAEDLSKVVRGELLKEQFRKRTIRFNEEPQIK